MSWHRGHTPGALARITRIGLGLVLSLALLGILAGCMPNPDSGIRGVVTIGPTVPVAQPGVADSRPYAATLSIVPKAGLHLGRPVTVTSASDGRFEVALTPGEYVVSAAAGAQGPPTLKPVEVTVRPHEYSSVQVGFDSGIR